MDEKLETKRRIREIIEENMDDLEDAVNEKIRQLLNDNGIDENENLDAITFARGIFYTFGK